MISFGLAIAFVFSVGLYAKEYSISSLDPLSDVIDELKSLRQEVEDNRKRILKQENELMTVKQELEETKRHCQCGPNRVIEKSESEKNEVYSKKENNINHIGGESRIKRIIPHTGQDGPIAFYAYMSTSVSNVGGHHTLVFDVIKTNAGNGLHSTSGVFMAPRSGFYVFTWTIRVYNTGQHSVELVVNGQGVGALYEHSGPGEDDMSSTTAVVYVNEGEDVFLRTKMDFNQGVIDTSVHGYSSFAGWKLN